MRLLLTAIGRWYLWAQLRSSAWRISSPFLPTMSLLSAHVEPVSAVAMFFHFWSSTKHGVIVEAPPIIYSMVENRIWIWGYGLRYSCATCVERFWVFLEFVLFVFVHWHGMIWLDELCLIVSLMRQVGGIKLSKLRRRRVLFVMCWILCRRWGRKLSFLCVTELSFYTGDDAEYWLPGVVC